MGDVMRCAKIRCVVRIRITIRYICMVRIRKYMSKVSERFLTCCFACTLGFRINARPTAAGDWGFFDTRKCRFRYKISLYIGSKTPRECLCVPAPPVRRSAVEFLKRFNYRYEYVNATRGAKIQGDSYYTSGDPSCFSKPFFWAAAPDERYAPGRQGRKGRRVFGGARLHVDTDRSIVGRT
jgi:hypothetical protein